MILSLPIYSGSVVSNYVLYVKAACIACTSIYTRDANR
jgi:hypothetical protein